MAVYESDLRKEAREAEEALHNGDVKKWQAFLNKYKKDNETAEGYAARLASEGLLDTYTQTDGSDWYKRYTFINPLTGKEVYTNLKAGWDWTDGYHYNNMFMTSNVSDISTAIGYMLQYGWEDTPTNKSKLQKFLKLNGSPAPDSEMDEIIHDAEKFLNDEGIDIQELNDYYASGGVYSIDPEVLEKYRHINTQESAQESAYNAYYNDLYSLDEGTFGREMLDNYTQAEQNAAISNMQLAEAQYQQSAMQQAEVVKSITDQVKAERMARLRAGMSESQIANQDMQTMLNNMNALNQQAATMNQNRLAAQQQYNLAQDTAYQQYIQSLTGLGGTSAAMAASDAGDAYMQTRKRMKATGENYKTASKAVTGSGS